MKDKYLCTCGFNMFEIHNGYLTCCSCKREYRVSGIPSAERFNAERDRYIKFDKFTEGLKK